MSTRVREVEPQIAVDQAVPHPAVSTGNRSFASVLRDAVQAAERGRSARTPDTPPVTDTARALALQASIYRHAEQVEIVSKVVDHAVSAMKTILQTRL